MAVDLNRVVLLSRACHLVLRQVSGRPCEVRVWVRHDLVQDGDRHHVLDAYLVAGQTGCFLGVGHHRVVLDEERWCLPWIGRGYCPDEQLVLLAPVLVLQVCLGQVLVHLAWLQVLFLPPASAQVLLLVLVFQQQVLVRPLAGSEPWVQVSELQASILWPGLLALLPLAQRASWPGVLVRLVSSPLV